MIVFNVNCTGSPIDSFKNMGYTCIRYFFYCDQIIKMCIGTLRSINRNRNGRITRTCFRILRKTCTAPRRSFSDSKINIGTGFTKTSNKIICLKFSKTIVDYSTLIVIPLSTVSYTLLPMPTKA